MMYGINGFSPFHFIGFLPMIFFWVLVIYGIYFLVKQAGSPQKYSALDVLKTRYAKGEITREEFENMKKDIK